jgi:hypothetical protein
VGTSASPLVFVSYSSEDRAFAQGLIQELKKRGVSVWIDSAEIRVGDSVVDRLADGLSKCTHLLIVISQHYLTSAWCKAELRTILHRAIKSGTKRILPLTISSLPTSIWDEPPFLFIEDLRRLDLSPPHYQQKLTELLSVFDITEPVTLQASSEESSLNAIADFLRIENIDALRFRRHGIMHVLSTNSLKASYAEMGDLSLTFVTEEHIHFLNYMCGLSLNFSLRNSTNDEITIYSLEADVVHFVSAESVAFYALLRNLPKPSLGASAPIFTHALFVRLSTDPTKCVSGFGATDDSAAGRGIISPFNGFRRVDAVEQARFARPIERLRDFFRGRRRDADETPMTTNSIPSSMRFSLGPGDSDAFHCQAAGDRQGIFFFRLKVGFHYRDVKAERYSDEVYPCFAGIGYTDLRDRER